MTQTHQLRLGGEAINPGDHPMTDRMTFRRVVAGYYRSESRHEVYAEVWKEYDAAVGHYWRAALKGTETPYTGPGVGGGRFPTLCAAKRAAEAAISSEGLRDYQVRTVEQLGSAIRQGRAVMHSPAGAGKTA